MRISFRKASLWLDLLEDRLVQNVGTGLDYETWKQLTISITDDYTTPLATTSDAESGKLIGLDQVRAKTNYTGKGYSVAVIDSGVDYNHTSLGGGWGKRVVAGYDFVDNDSDPMDTNGHGTHVAGIIAASDSTFQGIAPEANIIALRVLGTNGSGSFDDVEQALRWVMANQATYNIVSVNMSLGSGNYQSNPYTFLEDEFSSLISSGVFLAVAAGNDFHEYASAPGLAYAGVSTSVVAVGAVYDSNVGRLDWGGGSVDHSTAADRLVGFSQRSSGLDLLAPGVNVRSSKLGGGSTNKSGTSMATPMVAGAGALLHQAFDANGLSARANQWTILDVMQRTGKLIIDGDDEDDTVVNTGLSFKRLDLKAAVNWLTPDSPTNPTSPSQPNNPASTVTIPFSLLHSTGTGFTSASSWTTSSQAWSNPVMGDFNADGRDDVAVWNTQNNQVAVGISNGSSLTVANWGTWLSTGAKLDISAGDFNGDGKTDLAGRNATTGDWEVLRSTGNAFIASTWTTWSTAGRWVDLQVGDADNDGKDDLLARHAESGQWWLAKAQAGSFSNHLWQTWSTEVNWVDVRSGDFNKDGKLDIVGRTTDNGAWWAGYSTGVSGFSRFVGAWSTAVTWKNVLIGDFNSDGRDDLLGQAGGEWWATFGSANQFVDQKFGYWSPGIAWYDIKAGDFNHDGKDDIVGYSPTFGEVWIGKSLGSQMVNQRWAQLPVGVDFRNVLVGDLNKDGNHDLITFGPQAINSGYADVVIKSVDPSVVNRPSTGVPISNAQPGSGGSLRSPLSSESRTHVSSLTIGSRPPALAINNNSTMLMPTFDLSERDADRTSPMTGRVLDMVLEEDA